MRPSSVRNNSNVDDDGSKIQKKPVFLSKVQREQLALQRRHDQISQHKRSFDPSSKSAHHHRRSSCDKRDRDSERRTITREEERERKRARLEKLAEREREREREVGAIKEQYGIDSVKPKKRVIKPSDKFRFSFDWENTEDTSRDINSLYQNPHEARPLFGLGFRAGMDRREQKKMAANRKKELHDEIRKKEGIEEKPEEAAAQRLKEEAADLYDSFDMRFDRHWSDKELDEMTDRDWRIFREDFNISYKGSRIPRPMRSWAESNLSSNLLKAVETAGYKTPSPIQMAAIPVGFKTHVKYKYSKTRRTNK